MNAQQDKSSYIWIDTLLRIIFWILLVFNTVILVKGLNPEPQTITVMYPDPIIIRIEYVTKEPEKEYTLEEIAIPEIKPRYGFTDDEVYLMAVLLSGSKYVDGDGEYDVDFHNQDNYEQIALVLNVVMNRVNSDKFPDTVEEVIWAPGQFSPMKRWVNGLPEVSDISLQKVREWCRAYDTYDPEAQTVPDSHLYFYGNGVINISRERWYS